MGMFSKEMAITLPLTICLYEFCFLRTKNRFTWKYIVPFFAIAWLIPLTMLITKSVNFKEMRRVAGSYPGISPTDYFLTQLRVMVTYLRLTLIPLNQSVDYDYPITNSIFQIPVILSLLLLLSILLTAFKLLKSYRLISFSIFWFFITLLPESSIIPIRDVIFEHRLYLPMLGFSLFLVSGLYYLFKQKSVKLTVTILSLSVICYSVVTYQRNKVWQDEFTLWGDAIHKSPNKARPYYNRGYAYHIKGDLDLAFSDYNKAIVIDPNYAEAYNNRGNAYQNKGDLNLAILDYSKAIEINPNYYYAYNNRGNVHKIKGEFDQAISDFNKAIEIKPNYAEAYNNRGNAYLKKGDLNLVLSDYSQAIEINPDYATAYNNRAIAYFKKQEYTKSWEDVHKAQVLGYQVNPEFMEQLKKLSGRKN
jgi:tetratricopeptide (TPR) repeat protein